MQINNRIVPLLIFIIGYSCKKNQVGGKSDIQGVVKHHASVMPGARVFVKYGTEDFPGPDTTRYDYMVKADEQGKFKISFYKGKYYLYAVVFDYSLNPPAWTVGGLPLNLRTNEDMSIILAVTEQH
ncbi:MAG: hypothetical protein N3F09_06385 [Bacteroidia bacterium]|nr:hypothetical protein [Bacteroidia bacterium]